MAIADILIKLLLIFIAVCAIFTLIICIGLVIQMNEPSYALIIEELNDSEIIPFTGYFNEKGEVVNTTSVISITEEDFKTFPKLAPIIRDKSQKSSFVNFNGRVTFRVDYWVDETSAFQSRFGSSGYLEHKGKRYWFGFIHVD